MKHIVLGVLAHVDAGKTTLSENLMYYGGTIRTKGRVDNKDTFFDNYEMEKERGITIFSKQGNFYAHNTRVTLIDTPGHVDFSAEMERTLGILDYAGLVISSPDGVDIHTQNLWKLLSRYSVPVFIFINKTDRKEASGEGIINEVKNKLSSGVIDFTWFNQKTYEDIAGADEGLIEKYLNGEEITDNDIAELVKKRIIFRFIQVRH